MMTIATIKIALTETCHQRRLLWYTDLWQSVVQLNLGAVTILITLAGQQWTWSVNFSKLWSMPPLPKWSTTWPSPPLHLDDGIQLFVPIAIDEAGPRLSCHCFSYSSDSCSPQLSLTDQSQRPVCSQQRESEKTGERSQERGEQFPAGFAHSGKDYQVKWGIFQRNSGRAVTWK